MFINSKFTMNISTDHFDLIINIWEKETYHEPVGEYYDISLEDKNSSKKTSLRVWFSQKYLNYDITLGDKSVEAILTEEIKQLLCNAKENLFEENYSVDYTPEGRTAHKRTYTL